MMAEMAHQTNLAPVEHAAKKTEEYIENRYGETKPQSKGENPFDQLSATAPSHSPKSPATSNNPFDPEPTPAVEPMEQAPPPPPSSNPFGESEQVPVVISNPFDEPGIDASKSSDAVASGGLLSFASVVQEEPTGLLDQGILERNSSFDMRDSFAEEILAEDNKSTPVSMDNRDTRLRSASKATPRSGQDDKTKLAVLKKAYKKLQEENKEIQAKLKSGDVGNSGMDGNASEESQQLKAALVEAESREAEMAVQGNEAKASLDRMSQKCQKLEAELVSMKATLVEKEEAKSSSALRYAEAMQGGLKTLLNQETFSDVHFIVDGRTLYAHKAVVAARSAILREKWQTDDILGEVVEMVVPKTPYDVFLAMLSYMYVGSEDISPELAMDAIVLSHKYEVLDFSAVSESIVEATITVDNVCTKLIALEHVGSQHLKNACYAVIRQDFTHVANTPEFGTLGVSLAKELFAAISPDPVHVAVEYGRDDVVMAQLYDDVDVNVTNARGDSLLRAALWQEQTKTAEMLVKLKADIHATRHDTGDSLLHEGAQEGRAGAITFLLDHEANKDALNKEGLTALDVACLGLQEEITMLLLQRKAKSQYRDAEGNSILHLACKDGNESKVVLAVDAVGDPMIQNSRGETPLHVAAIQGHEAVMFYLLESVTGGNVDPKDDKGWTPLRHALWEEKENIASMLCDVGADPNVTSEEEGQEGDTLLHLACLQGREKIAAFLINHNGDVNATSVLSQTPLDLVCANRHLYMDDRLVSLLLENGAKTSWVDEDGNTLLHLAARDGDEVKAELLLAQKVSPNLWNEAGERPLHLACKPGHYKVCDALLRHGAEVFNKDNKGQTPLHCAARFQNICVLIMTQKPDFDVNTGDDNGDTPLMLAVGGDKAPSVIRAMLEMGAQPSAMNKLGQTALHHLANQPTEAAGKIAALLLEAGCDVTIPDAEGNTVIHYASGVAGSNPNEELAICLVLKGCSLSSPNRDGYTPLDGLLDNPPPYIAQTLLKIRTRMLESIITPPVWLADHVVNHCQDCRKQFGRLQLTRKHHCRMCGRIVCSACSDQKRPIPKIGINEPVRVCKLCLEIVEC